MLDSKQTGLLGRGTPRAEGEQSEAAPKGGDRLGSPDPELTDRPRRRKFSAEYKLRVVQQADTCTRPGEIGALLRREGLYTSHLTTWRRQRDQGALLALRRPRGRRKADPRVAEQAQWQRRAERAEAELAKARHVIEVQGKVSALLEAWLDPKSATPEPRARSLSKS